ncbi:phage protein [Streptococcus dysgalactiae subsp. dysgalactiae]|uniref:Phage protein n=1 Tax=Streptococcus dysgalactiae subsp. dysgalactiae TaxID=99822 RepID=A0A380JWM3_STRDY|nr:DUF1642 domain-containing protein [Streptococcus dysgalactiae]SUN50770.1 phage protein [Streptococcus dysgalactiae subsp. dysgalactiae]VDZ41172.1 phage protein [Streptococcus dysgalactiae subsp. dysgalactiae]
MNIEEAKELVDSSWFFGKSTGDIKAEVKVIIDQIDQQKPEVPQFVAECLEEDKKGNLVPSQYTNEVFEWMKEDNNAFVYLDAWVNGYTVKKEKLYTVDLPNGQPLVRGINTLYFSQNLATENVKLTEFEIRKDFDWAWQFAKEVTE